MSYKIFQPERTILTYKNPESNLSPNTITIISAMLLSFQTAHYFLVDFQMD